MPDPVRGVGVMEMNWLWILPLRTSQARAGGRLVGRTLGIVAKSASVVTFHCQEQGVCSPVLSWELQELRACCISVISKQGSTVVESPGNLSSSPGLAASRLYDTGQVILPL